MDCNQFTKNIIPYLTEDDFDDGLGKEIKEHYLSCESCWNIFNTYLGIIDVMHEITPSLVIEYMAKNYIINMVEAGRRFETEHLSPQKTLPPDYDAGEDIRLIKLKPNFIYDYKGNTDQLRKDLDQLFRLPKKYSKELIRHKDVDELKKTFKKENIDELEGSLHLNLCVVLVMALIDPKKKKKSALKMSLKNMPKNITESFLEDISNGIARIGLLPTKTKIMPNLKQFEIINKLIQDVSFVE
ncbi:hypothetical protein TRIP_B350093 [uncultured Desulfatiglans sp.]|nr:hypothetical protein TRIP_B350093 [uncultured Desulfatiglans sp.]